MVPVSPPHLLWFIPAPPALAGCWEPLAVPRSAVVCLILPGSVWGGWQLGHRRDPLVHCPFAGVSQHHGVLSLPEPTELLCCPKPHMGEQGVPLFLCRGRGDLLGGCLPGWGGGVGGGWEHQDPRCVASVPQFPHCLG